MEYIRPSLDHINSLVVSDYEQLTKSGWNQDFDLYVRRGGHFVIRLLQDCYAANGVRIPSYGVDSFRYTDLGEALQRPMITLPTGVDFAGKSVLVVDDVADEAATLIAIRDVIFERSGADVNLRFLTLYKKPWAKLVPDYWAEETDKWIIFPWEPYEILTQIVKRKVAMGELVTEIRNAGFDQGDLRSYLRVLRASRGKDPRVEAKIGEVLRLLEETGTLVRTV